MSLNAPAVSEIALESSVSALFNEWLSGYFDGGIHAIGANAATTFPSAVLLFQQASIPQPLNGVAISMVWVTRSKPRLYWEPIQGRRQQRAWLDAAWMFIVRAQLKQSGSGNAKKLGLDTSDLLYAILQNSMSAKPLAEKGIHHLRPETPQLMSEGTGVQPGDTGYIMRSITCPARVRYPILSQPIT